MIDAFINSPIYTILAFVFVLGVMIFVHEFGHFAVAKLQGIRVLTFSLGFGPRLWGFRRGDTEYRLSILPLGGYVKMAGENFDETVTGAPDEFLSRPKHQRFLVVIAGPSMNILLAIVLMAINFNFGIQVPSYLKGPAVIGRVRPGSPAESAGLQAKDLILAIDGNAVSAWEDVQMAIGTSPNQELDIAINRGGNQKRTIRVTTRAIGTPEIGDAGLQPYLPRPAIGRVEPGTPAEKAGLKRGDILERVRFEDVVAEDQYSIQALTTQSEGKELEFTLRRGDKILHKTIVPVMMPPPLGVDLPSRVRVGFAFKEETSIEQYGILESFSKSVEQNYRFCALTFGIIGKMVSGRASIKSLSGPIDIAYYSGQAARSGLRVLMGFMAIISLQLGILNLLPIPILDGGVIFLLFLETLLRRDISVAVKEKIVQVGLAFLLLLMGVVIFNDISKRFF